MQTFLINCPFCDRKLCTRNWLKNVTHYVCENADCEYHSQSRYAESWSEDKIVTQIFMLDKFYIKVDFEENTTTISELDVIILLNTVIIPRAQIFNVKNYQASLDKLKLMLTFS